MPEGEGLGRLSSDALLKRTTLTEDGGRGGEERRQAVARELGAQPQIAEAWTT